MRNTVDSLRCGARRLAPFLRPGIFLVLLFAWGGPLPSSPAVAGGKDGAALFARGQVFHREGAFAEAADLYLRALATEERAPWRLALARAFRDAERWTLAAFSYRRYLKDRPDDELASVEGAGVFVKAGFLAEAMRTYRKIGEKDPALARDGRVQIFVAMGDRAMKEKRWARARKAYRRATRLSAFSAWTRNRLVQALLVMDRELSGTKRHAELLDVLLELYVEMPDPVLGDRIRETFLLAGAPEGLRRRVDACQEE